MIFKNFPNLAEFCLKLGYKLQLQVGGHLSNWPGGAETVASIDKRERLRNLQLSRKKILKKMKNFLRWCLERSDLWEVVSSNVEQTSRFEPTISRFLEGSIFTI